jgi:hypothetical protein
MGSYSGWRVEERRFAAEGWGDLKKAQARAIGLAPEEVVLPEFVPPEFVPPEVVMPEAVPPPEVVLLEGGLLQAAIPEFVPMPEIAPALVDPLVEVTFAVVVALGVDLRGPGLGPGASGTFVEFAAKAGLGAGSLACSRVVGLGEAVGGREGVRLAAVEGSWFVGEEEVGGRSRSLEAVGGRVKLVAAVGLEEIGEVVVGAEAETPVVAGFVDEGVEMAVEAQLEIGVGDPGAVTPVVEGHFVEEVVGTAVEAEFGFVVVVGDPEAVT